MPNSDLVVPNPLKPKFGFPRERRRLTTVFAVKCRDGIILCSDAQETVDYGGWGTKEAVTKIHQFSGMRDKFCLLGCSGATTYINQLREHIQRALLNRGHERYFHALDEGVKSYVNYVLDRSGDMGKGEPLANSYPNAIFAGYDPLDRTTHLYEVEPPDPPNEATRTAIGTGGLYVRLLLGIAETVIDRMTPLQPKNPDFAMSWSELSCKLVGQFCYFVLARVMGYDVNSGMRASVYIIDENGFRGLNDEALFPGHGSRGERRFTIFAKTALDELPKDCLLRLTELYDLGSIIQRFSASAKGQASFP